MVTYRQLPPDERESNLARTSKQLLSRYTRQNQPLTMRVIDAEHDQRIELPAGAVTLLMDILGAMASGQGITLITENAELTTVQAADILNVSRPFLVKLLEDGQIPYRKVGKDRRIRMEDVMSYKQTNDQEREDVLDQLVADAQDQGIGYEEDGAFHAKPDDRCQPHSDPSTRSKN
jgi:excisionase family DNA binding protein